MRDFPSSRPQTDTGDREQMPWLKRIELRGFKQFRDPNRMTLGSGVTAIRGRGGTGKTNVLHAIRWVLGERSLDALRCLDRGELIFGGSAKSKAGSVAEVRAVLHPDPDSMWGVVVARGLERTGTDEHLINGRSCRHEDVVSIVNDRWGTGPKYVSNGLMLTILADLRVLIEQAIEERCSLGPIVHTFDEVRRAIDSHLGELYSRISGGGRAKLVLKDPSNPDASSLDISVTPPGGARTDYLGLSMGQKTEVALAFLLALNTWTSRPVLMLDDIDAMLDAASSRRLAGVLSSLSGSTQIIIVTRHEEIAEQCESVYETFEPEPGVSAIRPVDPSDGTA